MTGERFVGFKLYNKAKEKIAAFKGGRQLAQKGLLLFAALMFWIGVPAERAWAYQESQDVAEADEHYGDLEGSISRHRMILHTGERQRIRIHDAAGEVNWSSSDPSVAEYTDGMVLGNKTGRTVIIAEDANQSYECEVLVKASDIIGHMGYSQAYPENSMEAFSAAADEGDWGIECDLRRTNGELWCAHDGDQVGTEESCRFSDYLDICLEYECIAVLDIKVGSDVMELVDEAMQMIDDRDMRDVVIWQCDDVDTLRYIRRHFESARLWILVMDDRHYERAIETCEEVLYEGVNLSMRMFSVSACEELTSIETDCVDARHMKVCVHTINTEETRQELRDLGVMYLMSDAL